MSGNRKNTRMFGPQLDPRIERIFRPMCAAASPELVSRIGEQIHSHVREVEQALQRNEFLDVETVRAAAAVLDGLLEGLESYSERQQALIVGAARYFVRADDAEPDTASILGFDDDVVVLNYVLDQIGRPEQKIEL